MIILAVSGVGRALKEVTKFTSWTKIIKKAHLSSCKGYRLMSTSNIPLSTNESQNKQDSIGSLSLSSKTNDERLEGIVRQVNGNDVHIQFRRFSRIYECPEGDASKYQQGAKVTFSKMNLTVDNIQEQLKGTAQRSFKKDRKNQCASKIVHVHQPSEISAILILVIIGFGLAFALEFVVAIFSLIFDLLENLWKSLV